MKLTILAENQIGFLGRKTKAHETCSAEWGFSAYLETGHVNILCDTGHSEIYKNNAKHLGVDLDSADFVVLSHHHWDHAKGLLNHEFIDKKKLIFHPDVLEKVPKSDAQKYKNDFEIIESAKPLEFNPGVFFLGQIPRTTNFEKGEYNGDPMNDDTAIAVNTENGLFILTGCSHSGVVNICKYAKQVAGQKIHTVAGGFHLFENDPAAVDGAIDFFKSEETIKNIYPMHCIDPPSFVKFYTELGAVKYGVGDVVEV